MPPSSPTTAGATYLNRTQRLDDLRLAVGRAAARLPTIERVLLFGSLVAGTPTPRSDADLIVVVRTSDHAQPRDRVPEVLEALAPLPCPLDLFVLTSEEFDRARREGTPLVRIALASGIDLLERPQLARGP